MNRVLKCLVAMMLLVCIASTMVACVVLDSIIRIGYKIDAPGERYNEAKSNFDKNQKAMGNISFNIETNSGLNSSYVASISIHGYREANVAVTSTSSPVSIKYDADTDTMTTDMEVKGKKNSIQQSFSFTARADHACRIIVSVELRDKSGKFIESTSSTVSFN